MKIGPIVISRMRKNRSGHRQFPWEAITADRCSPELRAVVAKVARSEVKSYLQEQAEQAEAKRESA